MWLHQGLWAKVLGRDRRHTDIVRGLPGPWSHRARPLTITLGLGETALGLAVLSGRRPTVVAAAQTAALIAFNVGGLIWGRSEISHPGRLLARNAAFVAVVWSVARDDLR